MAKDCALVLIVDDEEVDRVVMRRTLERAGYTVVEAATYQAAVDLFRETPGEVDLATYGATRANAQAAAEVLAGAPVAVAATLAS